LKQAVATRLPCWQLSSHSHHHHHHHHHYHSTTPLSFGPSLTTLPGPSVPSRSTPPPQHNIIIINRPVKKASHLDADSTALDAPLTTKQDDLKPRTHQVLCTTTATLGIPPSRLTQPPQIDRSVEKALHLDGDSTALDALLPAKQGDLELAKLPAPSRLVIYLLDGLPVLLDTSGKSDFVPTVMGLWSCPGLLPVVMCKAWQVSQYLCGGGLPFGVVGSIFVHRALTT
jgi:hypothetical protein